VHPWVLGVVVDAATTVSGRYVVPGRPGPVVAVEAKLLGLLDAGDPRGEVRTAWHANEVVRQVDDQHDPDLALEFVTRLGHDLQDQDCPPEVRQLGRTIVRWREQIAAWHRAHVSNGPTEAANNLIKRVKRVALGSAGSSTTGSVSCSTPDIPTGTYSPPSLPAEIRKAEFLR
jgi:hypothetical protein